VKIGATVKIAHVDQARDSLQNDKTVFDAISGGNDILTVGKYETPARAYIGRFNFKAAIRPSSSANFPAANAAGCTWR